ncbi:hypothetical protein [uncultured Dysosmobacter sp.]|jgi:hypothetical protein|uniref:hypothetical protein n=1 Tax=uncultured Dysosmobacter sp. TaxID=2591384 RepID=UPI002632FBF0|nr:hypothetical protein [uncultured Dysosmobacter sp.]
MGKWRVSTDAKEIAIPFTLTIVYCVYVACSKAPAIITNIGYLGNSICISTDIYFYSQFILGFFITAITARQFSELLKPSSFEFLKTLPLSLFQLWIKRKACLLGIILAITIPMEFLLVVKVNHGIVAYGSAFAIDVVNISLPWQASVIRIIISANFFIVLTVFLLTIFKNEIISNCLIYVYLLLEMGPVGSFWGENSFFYGCFSPFPCADFFPSNISWMLIISVSIELYIVLWIKRNTR